MEYAKQRANNYDAVQLLYFGGKPENTDASTWYSMRAISVALNISVRQVRLIVEDIKREIRADLVELR